MTPVIVRPVASVDELMRTEEVIAAQFPPRRSTRPHAPAALAARFDANRTLMFVAEQDGTIVGGALAIRTGDGVKVESVALEPHVRRRGIGRRLMQAVEAEATHLGAQTMYLGGATADNRGFYARLGFAGRGSLMQKGLPSAGRYTSERLRRAAARSNVSSTTPS